MGVEPTAAEIDAALDAVRTAARLCRRAQGRLARGETLTKSDDSPVTVADFAAQAVVAHGLIDRLGPIPLVGEERADDLDGRGELTASVGTLVRDAVSPDLDDRSVLELLAAGGADATGDRWWTLDPIDGTKGFLRGDQYAIALALVVGGEVVLGVLGCPNLPLQSVPDADGAVFVAASGRCREHAVDPSRADPVDVSVAAPGPISAARLCESVEAAHSDHDVSSAIVERLGLAAEPFRIDSQCKYASVARGDASIYLRLPTRRGYREKIWDHAAGKFVVEQAGGRVTDVRGVPLDFGHGRRLEANRGVVATDGHHHDAVVDAIAEVGLPLLPDDV